MRINVYAEELTSETSLETKTVTDDKFGTRTFYGLRMWLASPDSLHADPEDDDRSAITIWVPWTRADGHDFQAVADVVVGLSMRLREATIQEHAQPGEQPREQAVQCRGCRQMTWNRSALCDVCQGAVR